MQLAYVTSSDSSSNTNQVNGSGNTPQTNNPPPTTHNWNNWARLVSEYAYFNDSYTPSTTTAGPSSTFGSNPNPRYDPNAPADLSSNNGQVAANGLLRLEEFGPAYDPQAEAQLVAQTLGQHKNDPQFLQQYLGTLGSGRVAQLFSYLASPGAVQTPFTSINGQTPQQLQQDYQNIADALSTLVKSNDFSQSDMKDFVTQFANTNPQVNFFAKDVLSKASSDVNLSFYQAAEQYALQNSGTSGGQSMAAYAMQALWQTSNPLPILANLSSDDLSKLVSAAMKGEAAYGNPPSIEEFSQTGVFRAQNGQGDPLDGLTNLMFDTAYAGISDQFGPGPLQPNVAAKLQANLFEDAITTLESDPSVKSFYTQGTSMKDALCVLFQNGYDSILNLKDYRGEQDGELSGKGIEAFKEFFADAVFTPPPSVYALGTVQMMQSKIADYINQANSMSPNAQPSQQQYAYAQSLGEQAQAMAAGLQEALSSILSGAAQTDANTKDLLNQIISFGGIGAGALGGGIPGAIATSIISDALNHLVDNINSGPSDIQNVVNNLKSHGIDVDSYSAGAFYDLSTDIKWSNFRSPFQGGLSNAFDVIYAPQYSGG